MSQSLPTTSRRVPFPLRRRIGLRGMVALLFAAGALLVSLALSVGTYVTAQTYLVGQRQAVAQKQAFADAATFTRAMSAAGKDPYSVLSDQGYPSDVAVFVVLSGDQYSSSLTISSDSVPTELREAVGQGRAASTLAAVRTVSPATDGPENQTAVVVGTPIAALNGEFYQVTVTPDLTQTLDALPRVLGIVAATTTVAGALVGWWAARRALAPLNGVAKAAADIARGDLSTRLAHTDDPELRTIVKSFNAMVDAVNERIGRERRFTADVSHELRSPLTTLTTSVHLLKKRRDELPSQAVRAVDLIDTELGRFSRALSDLLELSRLDAGQVHLSDRLPIDDIIKQTIHETGRSTRINIMEGLAGSPELHVLGDKSQLHRIFVNLLDNADKYGGGATAVEVRHRDGFVVAHVDDSGEGVPEEDRERIFERFVRSGSRRSIPGTGLGLSLVREMVNAHHGTTSYSESPYGGARFTVRLPAAPPLEESASSVEDAV